MADYGIRKYRLSAPLLRRGLLEGFTLSETGALSCDLSRVEVMGRDISVVSTHPKSQNVTIRSIISAENAVNTTSQKVRFDLKPNKVFLFQKESGARIDFG